MRRVYRDGSRNGHSITAWCTSSRIEDHIYISVSSHIGATMNGQNDIANRCLSYAAPLARLLFEALESRPTNSTTYQ